MKRVIVVLAMTVLCGPACAQDSTDKRAPSKPVSAPQPRPIAIRVVDVSYTLWDCGMPGVPQSFWGWGVSVRSENATDKEATESFLADALQVTTAPGKRGLSDTFIFNSIACNAHQLVAQGLDGSLTFSANGLDTGVDIRKGATAVGNLTSSYDQQVKKYKFRLSLLPKQGVTLVFIFDSPKEVKPLTLLWPNAKPIDLK